VPAHARAGGEMFEPKQDLWPTSIPRRAMHADLAALMVPRGTGMAAALGKLGTAMVSKAQNVLTGARGRIADWSDDAASAPAPPMDRVGAVLSRQLASGLWGSEKETPLARLQATVLTLLELLDAGLTSSDARHRPQIRKAISALLELADKTADDMRWIRLS